MQAKNIYGWGVYGQVQSVAAAGIPDQMQPPTIILNAADNRYVLVSWIAPYDGSDAIIEYKIMFQSVDKSYYTTLEC